MTFFVGQKVVCVDVASGECCCCGRHEPGLHDIGTVTNVYQSFSSPVLELLEFPAPSCAHWGAGWLAESFRPLVDTRKSVSFTAGAPKDSERWDNRKVGSPRHRVRVNS